MASERRAIMTSCNMTSQESELVGKVAIVTGAGGEVGQAIAQDLLKAGARVAWVGRRERPLRRLLAALEDGAKNSLTVRADVRDEHDVSRMARVVLGKFGQIDILVNNAAVRGPTAPVTELCRSAWQEVLETNLTGSFLCARECLRHMILRRQGRVINISAAAGRMAYPLRASYAASKWGLIGLTKTLAQEAGKANISVNAVCPGPVEGPTLEGVLAQRARVLGLPVQEVRSQFLRSLARGHMVTTTDVSHLVLFLCSDGARNITGQAIDVNAGFGLWPGS